MTDGPEPTDDRVQAAAARTLEERDRLAEGADTIRDVATTHYRLTVDLSDSGDHGVS